jgi:hydrogenase 3 maturation protease
MDTHVQPLLRGKTVIVGIGNPLRGDDGFGPAFIARLHGKVNAVCIDVGNAPENYLGRIVKEAPDTIVLVDVAHLGLAPGQYRLLQPQEILHHGLTTHDMSSRMLIEFLQAETSATIMMLAVQPQQLGLGEPLSAPVTETLTVLEHLLCEALHA